MICVYFSGEQCGPLASIYRSITKGTKKLPTQTILFSPFSKGEANDFRYQKMILEKLRDIKVI